MFGLSGDALCPGGLWDGSFAAGIGMEGGIGMDFGKRSHGHHTEPWKNCPDFPALLRLRMIKAVVSIFQIPGMLDLRAMIPKNANIP